MKPLHAGPITSSPKGIKCGSNCQWSTRKGAVVTLSAPPARGYRFRAGDSLARRDEADLHASR